MRCVGYRWPHRAQRSVVGWDVNSNRNRARGNLALAYRFSPRRRAADANGSSGAGRPGPSTTMSRIWAVRSMALALIATGHARGLGAVGATLDCRTHPLSADLV